MPSGTPSPYLLTTTLDNRIIEVYTTEFLTLRNLSKRFGIDRVILKKILLRNNIEIRPTRKVVVGDLKLCSCCKELKPIDNYQVRNTGKYRLYSRCIPCVNKSASENRNPIINKSWKQNNKDKVRIHDKNKREKNKNNVLFQLKERIRTSIASCITAKRHKKTSTFILLGYTPYDLKIHLESRFEDGMNWGNYGTWHIDHVRPLASFEFNSEKDIILAWSLDNLQPLWSRNNIIKSSWHNGIRYSYSKTA